MTKIVWMSDPHFQNEGTIGGLDPRVRLATAITHANTHHGDAECNILSGDLVGDDIAGDYTALAKYLNASKLPVYPMMGNNDDRFGMRKHLRLHKDTDADFIQYAIDTSAGTMICLDTHKIGTHAGELCSARKDWLDHTLRETASNPAYIFMHHPPLALELPKQDEIMLDDSDGFLDLIKQYSHVKHLFMGHVHRPTCGTIRGIPFATIGAVSFQAPAPSPAWDWDSFIPAKEPPHYAVLHIANGDVTLQYTQFCSFDTGIVT